MSLIKCVLFTSFLGLAISGFCQQQVYIINENVPVHALDNYLQIIEDNGRSLTFEEIKNLGDNDFKNIKTDDIQLEPTSVYWGKLRLKNNSSNQDWYLELEDPYKGDIAWTRSNGKVDIYGLIGTEVVLHKKAGVDYPKSERSSDDHWILNNTLVNLPKNKTVTLFIRIEGNSFGFPPYFNLSLREKDYRFNQPLAPFEFTFHFFLFGVCFIIFIYHILQYIYSKEKIFLWFSIWAFLCTLTQMIHTGLDAETVLANVPSLRFPLWFAIPNLTLFSFFLFGREFVNSKQNYPLIDRCIVVLNSLVVLFIISHLLIFLIFNKKPVFTVLGLNYELSAVLSFIGLIISVWLAIQNDLFARYFGIGAIVACLSVLIGSLWSMDIIELPFDPYAWGILFQVVIYSFGIAYRQQQVAHLSELERMDNERQKAEILRIRDLDALKSKFFANLSHEFRTPLSLILGPLQSIEDTASKSDNNEVSMNLTSLKMIKKNAARLDDLISQLLELSKLDNSKVAVTLKYSNIENHINAIVDSFNLQAKRKNLNYYIQRPNRDKMAYFDSDKLDKIITNILTNAIKYTPPGGTISVLIEYETNYVHFSIEDTGPGISRENIEKIFERFYRVESSEDLGSGIGLALVKELVDLQNGVISVRSEVNKGTTFNITLPITLDLLPDDAIITDDRSKALPKTDSIENTEEQSKVVTDDSMLVTEDSSKSSILVVEDNLDLLEFIKSILDKKYEVLTAKNGEEGEEIAVKEIPDVIITDIRMPKKTGYELCDSLKLNVKTSHIPIIMLTAKVTQDDKLQGLKYGADAYITKPFNSKELLLRLENLIKGRERIWKYFKSLDGAMLKDVKLPSLEDKFLQQVFSIIRENIENEEFRVEDIGREVGFSRSQLHRKLKSLIDKAPHQLIIEIRLNEAKKLLESKALTVSEVAYAVGYNSLAHFTKSFKERFGTLPSKIADNSK